MRKKRIVSLLACGVIAAGTTVGLTACSSNDGITVWGSQDEQATLQQMVDLFLEQNSDVTIPIKVGVASAADAVTNLSVDATVGADVYCYVNDQLINLINYTALQPIPEAAVARIKEANTEASVNSAELNGDYYGYPYAADNGYFLYYNKNIMTEEEAGSLEGILEACKKNRKYFIYNMTEAWYVGAFFLGTAEGCVGGTYDVEYEGTVVSSAGTNFDQNVPGTEYSIAKVGGDAMVRLNSNKWFISGDDSTIAQYLTGDGTDTMFGACISGTWNASLIQEKLGDGYAATKLPTYHSEVTGEDYQMGSLMGYKHFGVNPHTKHASEAHRLAEFLTSEAMQELRFDNLQTGPSNKNVAKLPKIGESVALSALIKQGDYATPQGVFPDSYWNAMKAFGGNVCGQTPTITLDNLDDKLADFIKAFKE